MEKGRGPGRREGLYSMLLQLHVECHVAVMALCIQASHPAIGLPSAHPAVDGKAAPTELSKAPPFDKVVLKSKPNSQ